MTCSVDNIHTSIMFNIQTKQQYAWECIYPEMRRKKNTARNSDTGKNCAPHYDYVDDDDTRYKQAGPLLP